MITAAAVVVTVGCGPVTPAWKPVPALGSLCQWVRFDTEFAPEAVFGPMTPRCVILAYSWPPDGKGDVSWDWLPEAYVDAAGAAGYQPACGAGTTHPPVAVFRQRYGWMFGNDFSSDGTWVLVAYVRAEDEPSKAAVCRFLE